MLMGRWWGRGPVLLGVLAATLMIASGATGSQRRAPATPYEMPFPCAEQWVGSTRPGHSPSRNSVDWNRVDDQGDPVVAAAPGVVTIAQRRIDGGYGRFVLIDHLNGESSRYAHLDSVDVQPGQSVDAGTLIGTVGSTGNVTGPHLHFEERVGEAVVPAWAHGAPIALGGISASRNCADVPLAANLSGTSAAEPAVFRRTKYPKFEVAQPGLAPVLVRLGTAVDDPVLGDWDGDGVANYGVRDPRTRTFALLTPAGVVSIRYGGPADRPIAGDWNGDGRAEVGVRRAARAEFWLRGPDGLTTKVPLGDANDLAVTGDWNGDRITDLGVFDPLTATFTLRYTDAAGAAVVGVVPFGNAFDLPVVGDWDGNGTTDLGVWSRLTATYSERMAPNPFQPVTSVQAVVFGRPR